MTIKAEITISKDASLLKKSFEPEMAEWSRSKVRIKRLKDKIKSGIVVMGSVSGPKAFLIVGVTKDLTDRFHAGDIIRQIAPIVGGGGGGRPDLAQAGGTRPAKLDEALKEAHNIIANS